MELAQELENVMEHELENIVDLAQELEYIMEQAQELENIMEEAQEHENGMKPPEQHQWSLEQSQSTMHKENPTYKERMRNGAGPFWIQKDPTDTSPASPESIDGEAFLAASLATHCSS